MTMENRPRILFLTQYFPPEVGAPQARIFEMARLLARNGYDIQILTSMPNYPKGIIDKEYRGKLWHRETIENLSVIRTYIYPSNKVGFIPRLSNYFSFVISSVLVGVWLIRRPQVIITESPPLFLGISGYILSRIYRCKWIFNVSDLWPASAIRMGILKNRFLIRLANMLEQFCYEHSDAQTGQSVGTVRAIHQRWPAGQTILIPNGCDCSQFSPARRDENLRQRYRANGKIVVGYAGLLGLAQGVEVILEVANQFRDDRRVIFWLIGDGPEREMLEAKAQQQKLTNVVFVKLQPKSEMYRFIPSLDIAIIPLRYNLPGALPSKIYEAMACQIPVILLAKGDPKRLVERASAGIVADYNRPDVIAAALNKLTKDPEERLRLGQNGRAYVLAYHNRPAIAARMAEVLDCTLKNEWSTFGDGTSLTATSGPSSACISGDSHINI